MNRLALSGYCVIILLAACNLDLPPAGWAYKGFPHAEYFESTEQVMRWTMQNISYRYSHEWQTPEKTYQLRTGDCVDYALLAMYFCAEAGIDSSFVEIKCGEEGHVLVRDLQTGVLWDPQSAGTVTGVTIIGEKSYEDSLYLSVVGAR